MDEKTLTFNHCGKRVGGNTPGEEIFWVSITLEYDVAKRNLPYSLCRECAKRVFKDAIAPRELRMDIEKEFTDDELFEKFAEYELAKCK